MLLLFLCCKEALFFELEFQPQVGNFIRLLLCAFDSCRNELLQELSLKSVKLSLLRPIFQPFCISFHFSRRSGGERLVRERDIHRRACLHSVEEGLKAIKIARRNWIVLVIVTTRTANGETQKYRGGGRSHLT